MSKIKLTGDTSGYVEISAPNVAANNTLELGGGTKILTNLDNVFTGVTTYSGNIDLNANLDLDDNNKILLGTGDDLQIYHNGSESIILDAGTGQLNIRTDLLRVNNTNDNETLATFANNGAVSLYYDNSKKLETTTTGATVTGTLVSDSVTSELDLTAISSSISDTAVDIFVYDTRKDSDGGAWRKRTQHTSWYNETLNTATRGSRKEFPAVAVIVTEDTKVTIYDGDDPDLPMWMVFLSGPDSSNERLLRYAANKASAMLNAVLCVATRDTLSYISFIDEYHNLYHTQDEYYFPARTGIVDRNTIIGEPAGPLGNYGIVSSATNDVAMTVLPNAPIDDATGLPVPTIAVATDGGVSVIKDDGTVVDITANGYTPTDSKIDFDHLNNVLYLESGGYPQRQQIPGGDIIRSATGGRDRVYGGTSSYVPSILGTSSNIVTNSDGFATGSTSGLSILDYDSSQSQEMVAYAATSYNTGYMHGDIKGAFLSDTTVESLTANTNLASNFVQGSTNRLTSETYDNGDTSWQMVDNAGSANGYVVIELRGLTIGQSYIISMTWDNNAALDSGYNHRVAHKNGTADENDTNFTYWNKTNGSSEILTGVFTAQSVNDDDLVIYANAITLNITNFNVRAVDDEDRSVNNKGLRVNGTITKSAVATGADLVAYSGWSNGSTTGNYLKNRSSYNFGSSTTSALCIIGWFKHTSVSQYQYIGSVHNSSVSAGAVGLALNVSNGYPYVYDGNSTSTSSTAYNDGEWHCAVGIIAGGLRKIYVDGNDILTDTRTVYPDMSSVDSLAVGHYCDEPNVQYSFSGSLSLVRFSNTIPSPEQIKKIYEDEKMLFQENAKCTLYGSSDAVTALSYDEDTELLHVGTSSGRSDFQGLRRINNTTTAVTTAISASDDLIAEQ